MTKLLCGLATVLLFCGNSLAEEKGQNSWALKMQKLQVTLQDILTDVSSDERFYDQKNFKKIEANVALFSKLASDISANTPISPDGDPTIGMIAGEFSREAHHAHQVLQWGQRAYARNVLRSMTQYCIACHTKNDNGPQFVGLSSAPATLLPNSIERANYFASVREFDEALSTYSKVVEEGQKASPLPIAWEKAIRMSLAIAIRVKKDPDLALKVIQPVFSAKNVPLYLREQGAVWKDSLEKWKKEKKRGKPTEDSLYKDGLRLVQEAKALQKYPVDRSADVLFLRASATLHDLLASSPKGKRSAEALYLAGLTYEVLGNSDLWDMSQLYYLGCIAKVPNTTLAKNCFRQYEEKVYLSYSGSSGLHLPPDVQERLKQLDHLSVPKDKKVEIDRSVH